MIMMEGGGGGGAKDLLHFFPVLIVLRCQEAALYCTVLYCTSLYMPVLHCTGGCQKEAGQYHKKAPQRLHK